MEVRIIGNGVWGNALFSVIKHNCTDITILSRGQTAVNPDVVILSVPTQSIREALAHVDFKDKKKIIINTAKGIERQTHMLPHQVVQSVMPDVEYYTLIGPSFSQEVVQQMPTLINLGYFKGEQNAQEIKKILQTDYFRVQLTNSVEVLEFSAAFKNIYAIACGIAYGLGYSTNTRVQLLVLAIDEMNNFYKNLQWKIDKDVSAGTIGDLILTCSSMESRNFTFGSFLTKYHTQEALQKVYSTVEGYNTLFSLEHFEKQAKAKLPLANFVSQIVGSDSPSTIKQEFDRFVSNV